MPIYCQMEIDSRQLWSARAAEAKVTKAKQAAFHRARHGGTLNWTSQCAGQIQCHPRPQVSQHFQLAVASVRECFMSTIVGILGQLMSQLNLFAHLCLHGTPKS